MDEQSRKEAAEIRKLPISLLEYLPALRWRVLSALIVLVVFLIILLVQMLNTHSRYAQLEAELDSYESLWESQEILSYVYTLKVWESQGMSSSKHTLKVWVNEGHSEVSGGSALDIDSYDTVPDLFNIIRKALGETENGILEVVIAYNPDLGYPTYIGLNDSPDIGRVHFTYTISYFTVLEQGLTIK